MKWNIAAPFFQSPDSVWIDNYIYDKDLVFEKIPRTVDFQSWHTRKSNTTGAKEWLRYWSQAKRTLTSPCDGLITVFPQLPVMAGLQMRFSHDDRPLVAWCFNLGACYPGLKQKLSRLALARVSKFVVHSTAEIYTYSNWLNVPCEKFAFVPLQRGDLPIEETEDTEDPFVLSIGSAKRDYATFFEAIGRLGYRTVVIASELAIKDQRIPDNVQVLHNLSHADCRRYVQRARINVVPINNNKTASGQVTVIEAMKFGRPVIASKCIGTVDYINHGVDGILVEPASVEDLSEAIETLWQDVNFRQRLSISAKDTADRKYSDQAAAESLGRILREMR